MLYGEASEFRLNETLRALDRVRHLIEPDRLISRANVFSESAFETCFTSSLARFWARGARRGNGIVDELRTSTALCNDLTRV
jgi:hypothetical protein